MSVYERNTLSNGLRVLTAPLPHAQSVACYIMLAAGSRYEDAGNRGIAHFAEHMFFKGTEKRPTARDLSMEVDKIGGEFNAFTSKEYTGYYIRCAGEQRDVALDVLVDMLRNSKFDAEELEREKGVIIEEMNMYIDTPRDYVSSLYEELLFGSNPLGWETLGTRETIKAASRETFLWGTACKPIGRPRKAKPTTTDRDAQLEYISRQVRAFQEDDQPAISLDAKKKENIGDFRIPAGSGIAVAGRRRSVPRTFRTSGWVRPSPRDL